MFNKLKSLFTKSAYALFTSVNRTNYTASKSQLLDLNEASLYANRAINKRAEKVGQIEFTLTKGETLIEKHPILDLLNRPNSYHTGAQFWKLYQRHYDICGAAFIFIEKSGDIFEVGKAKALHLLRPDLVTVVFNSDNSEIVGFQYTSATGPQVTFAPEDVLYSFEPDPRFPLQGESLLRSGIRQIDTDIQLSEYHNKILRNGGKIDGVFTFKNVNKTQAAELKEAYKDQYATAAKAGMPLFLGGEAEYKPLALNPDELAYLQSKGLTLNDICILTGVPKAVLASVGEETFANAEISHTIFLRETVKPLLMGLTAFLDWRLVPKDLTLGFIDPTPEDVDRKIKLITAASEVNALTTNEKREMLGFDPLDGQEADQVLIPFTVTTLDKVNEEPEPAPAPQEEKKKGLDHHPLRDGFIRRKYGELQYKRLTRREKVLKQAMVRMFNDQRLRLIASIEGAKHFRKKSLLDEAFDKTVEIKIARDTIIPIIQDIVREAGTDVYQLFETGFEFYLTSSIRSWVDQRGNVFAEDVTETTFNKLNKELEESLSLNETRPQLVKRIEGVYDGFTKTRAQTIARTETHGAVQKGTFEGYTQAGSNIKIWVWVPGVKGGVRDEHMAIDGEERPINAPFSNGLQFPGDPSAPASEVVNCACTL